MAGKLLKQAFVALRAAGYQARLNLSETAYNKMPSADDAGVKFCATFAHDPSVMHWEGMDDPLPILKVLAVNGIRAYWEGSDADCIYILNPED